MTMRVKRWNAYKHSSSGQYALVSVVMEKHLYSRTTVWPVELVLGGVIDKSDRLIRVGRQRTLVFFNTLEYYSGSTERL
jgi:hypothetical protein